MLPEDCVRWPSSKHWCFDGGMWKLPDEILFEPPSAQAALRSTDTATEVQSLAIATANVTTCLDAEPQRLVGLNVAARSLELQSQFAQLGLDIVGVQEARTSQDKRASGFYTIVSSGCTSRKQLGTELWLRRDIASPDQIQPLATDPRILFV